MSVELVSLEPATGAEFWRGPVGDVDAEVALAREAWPEWAARPVTVRIEALRRFADVVRAKADTLADCISRETGKPLWEARTEIESVIAKVDISVKAFADRTSQRRIEGAMGAKSALRHKPHGVMAALGPYNFPAHLPNGHIVPALIAGNAVVFKPSEKTPATGKMLVELYHAAGIPMGVIRCLVGGVDEGKALAAISTGCCLRGHRARGSHSTGFMLICRARCSRSKWAATIPSWFGMLPIFRRRQQLLFSRPFCQRVSAALRRGA
jgi:succinylglutamic semialdehyde dehydrogenase